MINLSSDMMAASALVTSIATLLGVVLQLLNSFRNTRKIDATHDIAVRTFNATGGVNINKEG